MPKKTREALIHFELYRHLKNTLDTVDKKKFVKIQFNYVEPEYSENIIGEADLVVFDITKRPWFVIETKRLDGDKINRSIDPFSLKVITQAYNYASQLGAPYFSTFNGEYFVLFKTFEKFTTLLDRQAKAYLVKDLKLFSNEILFEVDHLESNLKEWDTNENLIVNRLKSLHGILKNNLLSSIKNTLENDSNFGKEFIKFFASQGRNIKDLRILIIILAEQSSYMMINRLFFLRILTSNPKYNFKIPNFDFDNLLPSIFKSFNLVKTEINFEAVFDLDPIFDKIDYDTSIDLLTEFLKELNSWNLDQLGNDIVGHIYQKVIPPDIRHDLGQYYTPPAIIDIISNLCILNKEDKILDPACGSGGFLIGAYKKIKNLNPSFSHQNILDHLYGIDINRFPAHLTAINLAMQDLNSKTSKTHLVISDFFEIIQRQTKYFVERSSVSGTSISKENTLELQMPINFDAVISNPPYIRHELIPNKDRVRRHLNQKEKELIINTSDIYVYFLTYSTKFLKENGRIGFIVSERWLNNTYGIGLQNYLLDNYKINSIIAFDKQVFEDALIETLIVIMTKEKGDVKRANNFVKFLRLKKEINPKKINEILNQKSESEAEISNDIYSLIIKKQETLEKYKKWRLFIHAPKIYWDLLNEIPLVPLSEIALISNGIKSGINDFFYLTLEQLKELNIPLKYTKKLIKSVGQSDYIFYKQKYTEWYILDLEPFVKQVMKEISESITKTSSIAPSTDIATNVKKYLKSIGDSGLLKWIEKGEKNNYHKVKSVLNRPVWFSVGDVPIPPLVYTKEMWKKNIIYFNDDGLTIDQHLYSVYPKSEIDYLVLLGILNSDITGIFRDINGRIAAGEGMSRIENTVAEANDLLVIDPRKLSDVSKIKIRDAMLELKEKETKIIPQKSDGNFYEINEEYNKLRRNLNYSVLEALNLHNISRDVESEFLNLVNLRINMGGKDKRVLITNQIKTVGKVHLMGAEEVKGRKAKDNKGNKKKSLNKYF